MTDTSKRSGAADFFRYLFSFIVFVMHFRYYGGFESEYGQFNGGYLAVEYFFILGGFLLAQRAEKDRNGSGVIRRTAGYFLSRVKRILPAYWFSLAALLVTNIFLGYGDGYIRDFFTAGIPEIFLMQVFVHPHEIVLYNWYLSAMLWSGAAVYLAAAALGKWFYRIVCPAAVILGYGYLMAAFGHVDVIKYAPALVRAAAGMCLGCGIYAISRPGITSGHGMTSGHGKSSGHGATSGCRKSSGYGATSGHELSSRHGVTSGHGKSSEPGMTSGPGKSFAPGCAAVTAAEVLSSAAAVAIMYFNRHSMWDFAGTACMGALVWALFTGKGPLSRLMDRPLARYLGGLSMTVYLSQAMAQNIFNRFFWGAFPFPMASVLLFAGMTLWAMAVNMPGRVLALHKRHRALHGQH